MPRDLALIEVAAEVPKRLRDDALASARPKSCLDREASKGVVRKSLEEEAVWFKKG